MANNILSSLFAASPLKIINDLDKYQYWGSIAVKGVDVMLDSSVTDNPISNKSFTEESLYTDLLDVDTRNGKIIRPVRLKISCISDEQGIIESMMGAYANNTSTFTVTSKSIIAESMMVTNLTLTQSSEMISATDIVIEFEQSEPPITDEFDPANPSNRSNFGVRIQAPPSVLASDIKNLTGTLTSAVDSLYTKITSIL